MDRQIVYPSAIPIDLDILRPQQDAMVAIGYALQAAYAQNTVFIGLQCAQTAPASMQVTVGPGAIVSPSVIETTPFGSIAADTTDPLIKMGINISSTTFTISAPTISGQSQNYLIQCAFSESDDTPATLVYFNSLNPSQPYSGPSNSGTPQNTRRAQRANLQLKVGVPATTGVQVTPSVDSGWNGLYVITVAYGQTSITSTSISTFPNAAFLAPFLASHHGGVPGQAPRINLASEVQGVLPLANLPGAVGSSLVYAGNPNGHVAGTAASGSTPPVLCWDTVDNQWWTCTSTGTASTAVWTLPAVNLANEVTGVLATANLPAFPGRFLNTQYFTTPGTSTYTPTTGTNKIRVTVQGAGAGSAGCVATAAGQYSMGSASGGGAWAQKTLLLSTAGVSGATVTVGAGGTSVSGGGGNAGGSSSFGSFVAANGAPSTGNSGDVAAATTYVQAGGSGGPIGTSGDINVGGNPGGIGVTISGASINAPGGAGYIPGYGGGNYGTNNSASQAAHAGYSGQGGAVIIEEYS